MSPNVSSTIRSLSLTCSSCYGIVSSGKFLENDFVIFKVNVNLLCVARNFSLLTIIIIQQAAVSMQQHVTVFKNPTTIQHDS